MCLAVPGQVLSVEGDDPLARSARVDFSGVVRSVNLAFVPEARAGDYVLVHVGVALARIDEAEAARLLATLREIDALEEDAPDEATAGETSGPGDRGAGALRATASPEATAGETSGPGDRGAGAPRSTASPEFTSGDAR